MVSKTFITLMTNFLAAFGQNIHPPYTHRLYVPLHGLFYVHTPISSAEVLTRSLLRSRLHNFKGCPATSSIILVYFYVFRFYLSIFVSRFIALIKSTVLIYKPKALPKNNIKSRKLNTRNYSTFSRNSGKKLFKNYYLLCPDGEIVLSKLAITQLVDAFWRDVFSLEQDRHVLVQLRIKSTDTYYSLSKIQSISFKDKTRLLNILTESLDLIYERYTQFPIQDLFLRYSILSTNSPLARTTLRSNLTKIDHLDTITVFNLPTSLDLSTWGRVTKLNDSLSLVKNGNRSYTVQSDGDTRMVNVLLSTQEDVILSFKDEIVDAQRDEFIRTTGTGKVITYLAGERVKLVHRQRETAYITTVPKDRAAKFDVITLDLETQRLPSNDLRVVSAAFFDGQVYNTYFINDYSSSGDLLSGMLLDLFQSRNHGKTVYVHNLSGFDAMFLLKALAQLADGFDIIRKDDKIIKLTVTVGSNKGKIKIIFKDSLLLLPSSLQKLGSAFGVATKGEFDHGRSDLCVTPQDFEQVRKDLLAYNKHDCLVLYQVLEKFSELIFKLFRVDINQTPTISSLAMRIYRSNFMPKDARIGITDVKLFDKLHAAYTGGAVDVFQPLSSPGEPVYAYDVNSLYPAVMRDMDYPVGSPTFIEGSVDLNDPKTFGFLRVKVTSPTDLHVPLLQTKLEGRTVAALGSWTAWYFSEEIKMAESMGYRFEVIEAVLYERGQIFKDYVSNLYLMRQSYAKSDPRNLICKLLLNSLYGRFGMDPHLTE